MNKIIKVSSLLFFSFLNCKSMEQGSQALTDFDREEYVDAEGYWASSENLAQDEYNGKYPFPKCNANEWVGKQEFLKKLALIEQAAINFDFFDRNIKTGVYRFGSRGFAPSRLEPIELGNTEFQYLQQQANEERPKSIARWTDVLGSYYVEKFNVKPSRKFYEFVMKFEINK